MIFWLLVCGIPAFIVFPVMLCIFVEDDGAIGFGLGSGLFVTAICTISVYCAWDNHANDISRVVAQEHRIEVYQERIDAIETRLQRFDYPAKPGISLDADTPWASMVEALTQAETELAKAKDERAIAIRSIEARKRSPMSGVVRFVGDYE